jgi:DNA-binding CsgD family transcriptional regulator
LSLAVAMMGRSDEALRLAAECIGDAGRPEVIMPPDLDLAGAAIALATYHSGRIDDMEAVGDLTYADGLSLDDPVLRMMGSAVRGIAAVARGTPGIAGPLLDESISLLRPTDIDGLRALILGMRAYVAALSGDICLAEQSLERARAEGHPALKWYEPHLELGRASVLAASGLTAEAVALLELSGAEARRRGQGAFEFDVLFYAVRLGAGSPVLDRLVEVADGGDGALPALAARFARARAAGDGHELDAVAAGLESIGMCLIAAEAAGDAAGAHGAAGDRLAEARSLHLCRDLESRCIGLAPWVLRDRLARDSLTAREREAARLVASGLSNKEAAGHMQVSTRTVESHLDRVYAKLGINHRSQLAGVFGIGEPVTP